MDDGSTLRRNQKHLKFTKEPPILPDHEVTVEEPPIPDQRNLSNGENSTTPEPPRPPTPKAMSPHVVTTRSGRISQTPRKLDL